MIVSTPGTLGGKPRIDGHRIGVNHIVTWRYNMDWSVERIMEQFTLTRDEVQAALDYYDAHRTEIDAIIADEEAFYRQMTG